MLVTYSNVIFCLETEYEKQHNKIQVQVSKCAECTDCSRYAWVKVISAYKQSYNL